MRTLFILGFQRLAGPKYHQDFLAGSKLEFAPAPARLASTIGRPRVVGQRLPLLCNLAADFFQPWQLVELEWYGGTKRAMWLPRGTAVWYSTLWAEAHLPLHWVLVRNPKEKLETRAFFSTELAQSAASIAND